MKHLFILLALTAIYRSAQAQATPLLEDKIYETQVRTVQLYPNIGTAQDFLQPSSTTFQNQNLILEFDDFADNRSYYYVKFIHCNFDWTKSNLADIEFMDSYNEYPVNSFAFSGNTIERYIHYHFDVPAMKYPGNYVLVMYRDDISNLVLTRRMMVYDSRMSITKDDQWQGSGALNWQLQPLSFVVDYSDVQIINPSDAVHVNLRQNQRWDNAKYDVPSSFFREDQNQIEYRALDDSKQFYGGSEFRFVDFRSLNGPGLNTGKLLRNVRPFELWVLPDVSRGNDVYNQTKDYDGNYIVDNYDYGEPAVNGNYINVNFTLKADSPYDGEVYIVGKFNNYERNETSRMKYNATTSQYEGKQYLKQGYYEYQYVLDSKRQKPFTIEGSHFETENLYEVAVYAHMMRPAADFLLGYMIIAVNPH